MIIDQVGTRLRVLYVSERRHNRLDTIEDRVGRPYFLAKYLSERADVHWVTLHDGSPSMPDVERRDLGFGPIRIYNVPWVRGPWPLSYSQLSRAVVNVAKKVAPDVAILTSEMGEIASGLLAARLTSVPCVVDFMDDCASFPYYFNRRSVQNWVIRNSQLFSCASPLLRDMITKMNPQSDVFFLPNGFERPAVPQESREEIRQAFAIPPGAKVVLYAGTIRGANSGVKVLPEAVRIAQDNESGEILLAIVGPNLTAQADFWGQLPRGARILGPLPPTEVTRWMRCADVGTILNASSAFSEYAFPLKLFDYLGSGLRVVSTPISSARWASQQFDEVIVAQGFRATDVAEALLRALRGPRPGPLPSLEAYRWTALVSDFMDWIRTRVAPSAR
jgi:hypothetical protein